MRSTASIGGRLPDELESRAHASQGTVEQIPSLRKSTVWRLTKPPVLLERLYCIVRASALFGAWQQKRELAEVIRHMIGNRLRAE